ncbi:MAG: hypothetical protein ACK49X_01870 [Akkermansiaceae bacterium]
MTSTETRQDGDEARLWMAALFISFLLNGLLLAGITLEVISSEIKKKITLPAIAEQSIVTISPDMFEVEPVLENPKPEESESVRTSDDQVSPVVPESRRYIGERNTQATSDRNPTRDDVTMPSQAGRETRLKEEIETTESRYQDGRLDVPNQAAQPSPPATTPTEIQDPTTPPVETTKGEKQPDPGDAQISQTAIREKLLDGPNIKEKEVPKSDVQENIKPRDEKKTQNGDPQDVALKKPIQDPTSAKKPSSATSNDPVFRGNQSKTAIHGSISRTGRSALDVVDTPLGRYHAIISRAVELEWQRNCVRRRDFIVPGYLTARFFLDAQGRVTSVNLVGETKSDNLQEIQKGFTLDSIRAAEIPPMPADVRKEMDGDSLELIFNFYF